MSRLIISSPDGKRGILELTKPLVTIGRSTANDLVLNDSSVSRFHAVVKQHNETYAIADRGSTNGIAVNGERVAADTPLSNGAIVKIGVYELRFEVVNSATLVVRPAELSSGMHSVLERAASVQPFPISLPDTETPHGTLADLAAEVRKLKRDNYLLTVLYDTGKALQTKHSIENISEQVMSLTFRIEGVERGFMMMFQQDGEVTQQTEVRYRRPVTQEHPQIILSRSIIDRIRAEQQPILITDFTTDDRFRGSESMKISGIRSAMCAPLVSRGNVFGIIYVDNMEKTMAFTQEELNVFALVASQAAAAIDNSATHQQLAEQAIQRRALERFLSPDVVDLIAADPKNVRLGGTNQMVSVLFADIRGFTAISETMEPERIVEILNEFFTRVTDVIFDHGGTLDKYLGDGVMAVFGAPISKGNDAVNAVRAAVAIQKLVLQLNRDSADRNWPELRVGIGINTGIVTAGNIGSPKRIDYTVVGDTVNVASRLMSNATGGQVLISASVAQHVGAQGQKFPMTSLPPLTVKGKADALKVYELLWQGAAAGA